MRTQSPSTMGSQSGRRLRLQTVTGYRGRRETKIIISKLNGKMEKKGEGNAVFKSNEITGTPACPILAAVTLKASKREQANNKKSKQKVKTN
jgi:hypothetical protein